MICSSSVSHANFQFFKYFTLVSIGFLFEADIKVSGIMVFTINTGSKIIPEIKIEKFDKSYFLILSDMDELMGNQGYSSQPTMD